MPEDPLIRSLARAAMELGWHHPSDRVWRMDVPDERAGFLRHLWEYIVAHPPPEIKE